MDSMQDILKKLKIIPVLTVESAEQALQVCRALQAGGIRGVEITLRTPAALAAVAAVKDAVKTHNWDFVVGVGTLKSPADVEAVCKLEVDFAVSPGLTTTLSNSAKQNGLRLLPGVATASELLYGLEAGWDCFKLFPASAVGGIPLLKAFASPFSSVKFCPTGGIGPENFKDYLALPNVLAIGGSWMVASDLVQQGNWTRIAELSQACMN